MGAPPVEALDARVEQILRTRLPGLVLAVARRINIAQLAAASGTIRDLDIERVILGNATIEKLILQDTSVSIKAGNAYLSNVRVVLELQFTLDWWFDIWIYSDSGSVDLGSMYFSIDAGNILVPSLQNINLSIPSVSVDNMQASMPPVTNLDLGGASFTTFKATEATLPTDGFQVNGLGVGSLSLSSFQVPKTSIKEAALDRFLPNSQLVLPEAQVTGIQAPSTSVGTIQSSSILFDAIASRRGLSVSLGIFGVTVWVRPVAHMNIGAMILQDVALSALIRQATIRNVRVPLDVRGIQIKGIELNTVAVTDISM